MTAFGERDFRDAVARFPTGVSVITARARSGEFVGVTVSSLSSVSLEPALLSFSLQKSSHSAREFIEAGHFAISILAEDQQYLSRSFARKNSDKWSAIAPALGPSGCPLIRPNVAAFECAAYACYEGGDHWIFLGRVTHLETGDKDDPLVFFRSGYRRLCDHQYASHGGHPPHRANAKN